MSLFPPWLQLQVKIVLVLSLGCLLFLNIGCASRPHMVKRSQMLMGTLVFVTAVASDTEKAQEAVATGLAEIRRLEELWSTWISTSELSQINAAAGKTPVTVSPETMALLTQSFEMMRRTEGGFVITIGPAVKAWNISEQGRIPTDQELAHIFPLLEMSHVQLDEDASTALLAKPGMQLDVGGIGKGFAADFAAQAMRDVGATAGVVALSGDITTFGRMPDGHRFVFGIQHPREETGVVLARLELEDEAVSTAGDYQRFFMKNDRRYHHILDPQTLRPARHVQSVTIVAKTGVMADGLDTGIFVMGTEKGMALIERLPGVEGIIVDETGNILVSSGLKHRLMIETIQHNP
ncbi:MAG: FAD:protein FMN transferase [Nitrospirales bacterium]|nr:FAD:protein FMN transferase [Nitrospirales bacterium]